MIRTVTEIRSGASDNGDGQFLIRPGSLIFIYSVTKRSTVASRLPHGYHARNSIRLCEENTTMRFRLAKFLSLCGLVCTSAMAQDEGAKKPLVVLIGDSIRMGYAPEVIKALGPLADIRSPNENGGDTANVLKNLDAWVISAQPAVVHINAGLHDLKLDRKTGKHQVELKDYKANLRKILERITGETKATVIYAMTTPVLDDRHTANKPFDRLDADVQAYNAAARDILKDFPEIKVNDLYTFVKNREPEKALVADGVHFTPQASQVLGRRVADVIRLTALANPVFVAKRAKKAPVLDGKADEPEWADAKPITSFQAFWSGQKAKHPHTARILWDDEAMYFHAELPDEYLIAHGKNRNDKLWLGDVFELFFKPDANAPAYYELQANPLGTILELPIPRRGYPFEELAAKPHQGMTVAVDVQGSLENPGKTDKKWTVEGRIPWTLFAATGGKPKAGDIWRFQLSYYDYGPEGTEPELGSCAPLTILNYHRYEDYVGLRFEGDK
jgi:lysophospholipase L1-like esterase